MYMIYLDNASTTFFKPKRVKKAVKKALKHYTANASRSGHDFAVRTAMQVSKTREILASIFNCEQNMVIFTSGCTESLNLAIRGTCKKGGHIILTVYEHNSVLRVVEYLKHNYDISTTIILPEKNGKILPEQIEKAIKKNTYLLIVNHTSNVTGITQDLLSIGKIAKKYKILFLVDAAQSAGHKQIDMKKCNISMLALAGHKGLLGLQGVGALCVSKKVKISPIKFGGTGTFSESLKQPYDIPEGFESGTFSALNVISMGVGAKYAYDNLILINTKILKLAQKIINNLAKNKKIILYSNEKAESGVVSFNIVNMHPQNVATILNDKYKIAVRSGYACAPLVQKFLRTDALGGVVRVSIGYGNSIKDIKKFLSAIEEITLGISKN